MAPNLPDIIRYILEGKQVQSDHITYYVSQLGSLKGYLEGFKALWAVSKMQQVNLFTATTEQLASLILFLYKNHSGTAKNAYSACLLLPCFQGLRFTPLLKKMQASLE